MQKSKKNLGISAATAFRLANNQKDIGVRPFQLATLVYPVYFTSSSISSSVWSWQFRLNSLFDPDFTGTGNQPTTFDQWMTLYDRYRVIATDVELDVVNIDVNPIAVAFAPGIDAAPTLGYSALAGCRGAVIAKFGPYFNTRKIKKTYLMRDIFGVDEEAMMSELNYSGTSTTSAPFVAYGNIGLACTAATGSVMVSGMLRFAVRFENPHNNNVSLTKQNVPLVAAPSASAPPLSSTLVTTTHAPAICPCAACECARKMAGFCQPMSK